MKDRLRNWLQKWLGFDTLERRLIKSDARIDKLEELGEMGVDLGASEQSDSYIVIATKLKGGVVKIIPMRYERPDEVLRLMEELQSRYQIRRPIKDLPRGMKYPSF